MAEAQFVLRAKDEATPVFQRLGRSAKRLESTVNSIRFGAIGAGVAAIAGGFSLMAKGAIDAADNLSKLSQRVGITVERLSELQFAFELSDISLDEFQMGMRGLADTIGRAQDVTSKEAQLLKALGVSAKEPLEAFLQLADAVQAIEDPIVRVNVASEVLGGRVGQKLITALAGGRAGFEAAAASARKLGIVVSGETARAAEQFNDNLTKLSKVTQAFGIALSDKVVGGLASFTTGLVEAKEQGRLAGKVFEDILGTALELGAKLPLVGTAIAALRDTNALGVADAERRRAIGAGILSGAQDFAARRNAAGGFVGPQPPSDITERASCALSGGTWDAARRVCVPKASPKPKTGAAGETLDSLLAKAAMKRLEIQDAAAQEAEAAAKRANDELLDLEARASLLRIQRNDEAEQAANDRAQALRDEAQQWREIIDPVERYRREIERINLLESEGALGGEQAAAAREKVNQQIRELSTGTRQARSAAEELGLTFSSAFEDAIVSGKKFSDVLKGIGQDVARILIRKSITEPLASGIGDIFKGDGKGGGGAGRGLIDFAKNFFGFATGGSFTVGGGGGTDSQLVAFRATPGERVTVQTPAQQAGGGVVQNFNFTVGVGAEVRSTIAAMMPEIQRAASAGILDSKRRGGGFAAGLR
jgi:hypothetical protein